MVQSRGKRKAKQKRKKRVLKQKKKEKKNRKLKKLRIKLKRQVKRTHHRAFRFHDGNWKSVKSENMEELSFYKRTTPKKQFTVITYNVLFDCFHKDAIHTQDRIPKILDLLHGTHADIIALQEVEVPFLRELLKQEWVRNEYFISDNYRGKTVRPFGQVLLSKIPFKTVTLLKFSDFKKMIVVRDLQLGVGPVPVAVVHLTSDAARSCFRRRKWQLFHIFHILKKLEPKTQMVMGDFNFHTGPEEKLLQNWNYLDAWNHLNPDQNGFTFDPRKNSLAKLLTHKRSRFDRILFKSKYYRPKNIELIGNEPFYVNDMPNNLEELSQALRRAEDEDDPELLKQFTQDPDRQTTEEDDLGDASDIDEDEDEEEFEEYEEYEDEEDDDNDDDDDTSDEDDENTNDDENNDNEKNNVNDTVGEGLENEHGYESDFSLKKNRKDEIQTSKHDTSDANENGTKKTNEKSEQIIVEKMNSLSISEKETITDSKEKSSNVQKSSKSVSKMKLFPSDHFGVFSKFELKSKVRI